MVHRHMLHWPWPAFAGHVPIAVRGQPAVRPSRDWDPKCTCRIQHDCLPTFSRLGRTDRYNRVELDSREANQRTRKRQGPVVCRLLMNTMFGLPKRIVILGHHSGVVSISWFDDLDSRVHVAQLVQYICFFRPQMTIKLRHIVNYALCVYHLYVSRPAHGKVRVAIPPLLACSI